MHPRYKIRLQELCTQYKIPYHVMIGPSKKVKPSFHRRHLILKMSEEFPNLSTPQIGELFNRKHPTVVIARQKALVDRAKGEDPWSLIVSPTA